MNNKNLIINNILLYSQKVFTPYFITGFADGEGCFCLGLSPTKVQAIFQINLHVKDRAILEEIKTVSPPKGAPNNRMIWGKGGSRK